MRRGFKILNRNAVLNFSPQTAGPILGGRTLSRQADTRTHTQYSHTSRLPSEYLAPWWNNYPDMSNSAVIGVQREVWECGNVIKQPLSFKRSLTLRQKPRHTQRHLYRALKPDRPELSDPFLWLFLFFIFYLFFLKLTTFSVRGKKKNLSSRFLASAAVAKLLISLWLIS